MVTSVWSDAIPALGSKDKTTPLSSDGRYDKPPSKYSLTRHVYGSSHYGMGSMMVALTWRPSKPTGAMTLEPEIMATNSTS
jgi:hypothetical protein